ncbi:MAG TPA: hypothetical protein VF208_05075, partial [Candidatus Binatia bacterium]
IVRVGIPGEQTSLIEHKAGIPHRRAAAQQRQNHFRDHRFNYEQQRRIEEYSYCKNDNQNTRPDDGWLDFPAMLWIPIV